MAIKWSAVKVSEAMDEVEQQVLLADQFIAEAKTKAEAAKRIGNLPQYMEHRISRLIDQHCQVSVIYIRRGLSRLV